MKKVKCVISPFITILIFTSMSFGALPVKQADPLPGYLRAENFIGLSPSAFEAESGHKLNWIQKIYFKKVQRKLKRSVIGPETVILPYYDARKGKFKLDPVWLVLGCIIGPFAVLFSYTVKDQNKNKHLSALIGSAVFILWFGFIFLF